MLIFKSLYWTVVTLSIVVLILLDWQGRVDSLDFYLWVGVILVFTPVLYYLILKLFILNLFRIVGKGNSREIHLQIEELENGLTETVHEHNEEDDLIQLNLNRHTPDDRPEESAR